MIITRRPLRGLILTLTVAVTLAGCARMERFYGFTPDARELAQLQTGQTSRAAVIDLIGPPVSVGTLDDSTIYYVSSKFETFGPFAPQEVDRQVLVLRFDGDDLLRDVTRYTRADGEIIALDRRVTDDGIADVSVLGQLLGSFGRLDAATILGE
jgi:outer membrane protein assembly factor BamE (lipoprotein component of BamABCDE complex)